MWGGGESVGLAVCVDVQLKSYPGLTPINVRRGSAPPNNCGRCWQFHSFTVFQIQNSLGNYVLSGECVRGEAARWPGRGRGWTHTTHTALHLGEGCIDKLTWGRGKITCVFPNNLKYK